MPRSTRVRGTRVSFKIPPNLAARVAHSPKVAAEMGKVLIEIESRAQATVPVGSGKHGKYDPGVHLKDTLVKEVQITPKGVAGLIGYTAWWAHFVHNGTIRRTANPWLLNAALSVLVTQRSSNRAA